MWTRVSHVSRPGARAAWALPGFAPARTRRTQYHLLQPVPAARPDDATSGARDPRDPATGSGRRRPRREGPSRRVEIRVHERAEDPARGPPATRETVLR